MWMLLLALVLALAGHARSWSPVNEDFAPYADTIDWSPIDQLLQQQIGFVRV